MTVSPLFPKSEGAPSQPYRTPSVNAAVPPERIGKYILCLGKEQSGKTTCQNFLVRYLVEGGKFLCEPLSEDSRILLAKWRQSWQEGRFMPSTEFGTPKEYPHKITPLPGSGFSKPLVFRFLEMSGEELRGRVQFEPGGRQMLWPETAALLDRPDARLFIVLMVDGADLGSNDRFFVDLLSHIQTSLAPASFARLKKEAQVMFVISKPKEAQDELFRIGRRSDNPITQELIDTFLPEAKRHIQINWGQKALMARLSLGKIAEVEDNGVRSKYLETPNFRHIDAIFARIYHHLTGTGALRRALDQIWA